MKKVVVKEKVYVGFVNGPPVLGQRIHINLQHSFVKSFSFSYGYWILLPKEK